MIAQFLNAELVLFGENLNLNTNCHHEYLVKDGQIIIHQRLIRGAMFTQSRRSSQLKSFQEEEIAENGAELISSKPHISQLNTKTKIEYDEVSPVKRTMEGHVDGFYQTEENPYNEEYYGYDIDGQYLPEQFGSITPEQLFDSPQRNAHIPFSENSPTNPFSSSKKNQILLEDSQIAQENCSLVDEDDQINPVPRLTSQNIIGEFNSL